MPDLQLHPLVSRLRVSLLLLGISLPLSAAWSRVHQSYTYCGDSVASCALTVPAVGFGNLLAVAVTYNGSDVNISSAIGAANNWVHPSGCKAAISGYQAIDWIYALSAAGGKSITVTLSGNATYVDAFYFEYAGTAPLNFDSCSTPARGSSLNPNAGPLTTHGSNDLALAIVRGDQRITADSSSDVGQPPWASTPLLVSGGEAIIEAKNFDSLERSRAVFTASAPSNYVGVAIAFKDAATNPLHEKHAFKVAETPPKSNARDWIPQIAGDMGANEGHPEGAKGYGFYDGSVISDGNNPYASEAGGANAINYWGTVYADAKGNPANNTRVAIRNCRLYWKRASTGVWTTWGPDKYPGDVADYPENFQGSETKTNVRTESDGSMSVKPSPGRTSHWFGPYPRVEIDKNDLGGIVTVCQVRLVVDDPAKPDDRLTAKYLVNVGVDYNPATKGGGIENNPGVGGSKFKRVPTRWRSVAMTTLNRSQLAADPPPLDLTGDDP